MSERIGDLFNGDMPDDANWLSLLIQNRLDRLPMPGKGSTLERWSALAAVGQFDLSLTKLYEGHTDALAIIEEIGQEGIEVADGSWCVWAAEAPGGRALIRSSTDGSVVLSGSKHWCSGAVTADHGLLTAWEEDGSGPHLVAVELAQPGIAINADKWKAVGMASSMSVNVAFDGARGRRVGSLGEYLTRPGFWHGGAGIAACWYGGAVGVGGALRKMLLTSSGDTWGYKMAAMGRVQLAIEETAAVLRQSARWVDDHPSLDASRIALTARLSAERCSKTVIDEVGKAMGATPFCLDEKFAKAVADLPVFIRQSHADRDFAALGERSLKREATAWTL
ncbi:MAG: acyl-CoA dehydrogenase [Polaromonas sp.]